MGGSKQQSADTSTYRKSIDTRKVGTTAGHLAGGHVASRKRAHCDFGTRKVVQRRESRQATERHTGNRKASPATQVASVALSQILVVPISTNAVLVSAMYCVLLFDFLMSALY